MAQSDGDGYVSVFFYIEVEINKGMEFLFITGNNIIVFSLL